MIDRLIRKPAAFISTISDDRGQELLVSDFIFVQKSTGSLTVFSMLGCL